ncbi:hypothetical protein CISG_06740 [Coccidioides immitis RMSCC 3703]|nr:hypothetical protein CIRG_05269 [Coccidioides immitis RMSCC 2394]KMU77897.1 hypothetical protein CISG_06740 [Coccidioides immitis RMSCC 3703]
MSLSDLAGDAVLNQFLSSNESEKGSSWQDANYGYIMRESCELASVPGIATGVKLQFQPFSQKQLNYAQSSYLRAQEGLLIGPTSTIGSQPCTGLVNQVHLTATYMHSFSPPLLAYTSIPLFPKRARTFSSPTVPVETHQDLWFGRILDPTIDGRRT